MPVCYRHACLPAYFFLHWTGLWDAPKKVIVLTFIFIYCLIGYFYFEKQLKLEEGFASIAGKSTPQLIAFTSRGACFLSGLSIVIIAIYDMILRPATVTLNFVPMNLVRGILGLAFGVFLARASIKNPTCSTNAASLFSLTIGAFILAGWAYKIVKSLWKTF
jgi:hypothetical protein